MRDVIDQAQETIDALTQAAIANIRSNVSPKLKPKGECYYCEAEVGGSKLFCDVQCSKDYDVEQKARKIVRR